MGPDLPLKDPVAAMQHALIPLNFCHARAGFGWTVAVLRTGVHAGEMPRPLRCRIGRQARVIRARWRGIGARTDV